MDNIQGIANDKNSLIKFYKTANKIMPEANKLLQEWFSNSIKIEQSMAVRNIKVLGIKWNPQEDVHSIKRCELGNSK